MLQPRPKPGAAPRDGKRDALLDIAAQEFNAYGVAGASLARIARTLGTTRSALYYYIRDREDLAAQCYRRSCEIMADDLTEAAATAGTGFEKVLAFLRFALNPDRVPGAVLSEIEYLEGKARSAIVAAHTANVDALRALIRGGILDGSIRRCDDEVAVQVMIGTIYWVPLSVQWVEGTDRSFRRRTVDTLLDFVTRGQAANPAMAFHPSVSIRSFFEKPGSAFDRKAAVHAKTEELMMVASQMFNQRGIDGTSLDDIAGALGATKGTLYHYFKDKTDLVVKCYKRAFTLYERFTEASKAHQGNALERGLVGLYLNIQAHTSGLAPLTQTAGAAALPASARREITHRARVIQQWFESNGHAGLKDGSNRDIDFPTMSQFGAGAFEWLPKWLKSGDPRRDHVIADEIMAFFIRGIAAH